MAHIVEGILSAPVLVGGAVLAAGGVAYGLKRLDQRRVARAGVLTAAFMVAGLIQIPLPGTSAHLILNGLLGVVLGWSAVPAILVGLLLQATVFGIGGVTVLGVNCVILAAPALFAHYLFRFWRGGGLPGGDIMAGALAGGTAIFCTALLVAAALALSGREFHVAAQVVLVAHLPILAIEALVTGAAVRFIGRVRPDLLGDQALAVAPARL